MIPYEKLVLRGKPVKFTKRDCTTALATEVICGKLFIIYGAFIQSILRLFHSLSLFFAGGGAFSMKVSSFVSFKYYSGVTSKGSSLGS